MHTFTRGQKAKLADLGCPSGFDVALELAAHGLAIDVSCFGLDAAGQLADERFMVFYNQPQAPADAIKLKGSAFRVQLDALPPAIAKLVFVAAIDGAGSMRALGPSRLRLGDAVEFPFSGADFADEKAIIVGELYRRDGAWRFGAVGQGFHGGLSALLAHFGGVEAPPPAPKVSLSKVTLEKRGDKVSLEKRGAGFGRIHVNLNWNRRGASGLDLDLGCMYQLADGRPGVVQALGNAWGDYDRAPFIRLEGDDRTGDNKEGENLFINGQQFERIERALIFAFIYRGAPNWAATDGVVTIHAPDQPPVEVRLDGGGQQMTCAIAMIENRGGALQVTKLTEYFAPQGRLSGHELMDQRYGFGMRWTTGTKE